MTQSKDCVRAVGHGFYVKKKKTTQQTTCINVSPWSLPLWVILSWKFAIHCRNIQQLVVSVDRSSPDMSVSLIRPMGNSTVLQVGHSTAQFYKKITIQVMWYHIVLQIGYSMCIYSLSDRIITSITYRNKYSHIVMEYFRHNTNELRG